MCLCRTLASFLAAAQRACALRWSVSEPSFKSLSSRPARPRGRLRSRVHGYRATGLGRLPLAPSKHRGDDYSQFESMKDRKNPCQPKLPYPPSSVQVNAINSEHLKNVPPGKHTVELYGWFPRCDKSLIAYIARSRPNDVFRLGQAG